jgi:hypothetical protein
VIRSRFALTLVLFACGARSEPGDVAAAADASPVDAPIEAPIDAAAPDVLRGNCGDDLLLVQDDSTSTTLAMDDIWVYYFRDPDILRVEKQGSTYPCVTVQDGFGGALVVDDTYVYWTSEQGHLERAPKVGGTIDDLGCASTKGCPAAVRVAAITNDLVVLAEGPRAIAMSKQGGAPHPLYDQLGTPDPIRSMFADESRAYWNSATLVASSPLDGGTNELEYALASDALTVGSDHVYWTTNVNTPPSTWDLVAAPKHGGNSTLLSTSGTSGPLVANDMYVYGVASTGITRQPTSGGLSVTITPTVRPVTMLLDEECLYYLDKTSLLRRIVRTRN